MINSAKLKAKLVEMDLAQEAVAIQIGMSSATFNYKLNNKREFKASEIEKLISVLNLTPDEVSSIFFASQVDYLSTKWFETGVKKRGENVCDFQRN